MIIVRSPLRISFVGGGSDIPTYYNGNFGAVCSVTIDKYIYITAKENLSLYPHKYRLVYSQVETLTEPTDIKHPILNRLISDYKVPNLDLDVMSDIPAGTGMGSSSSFTVGMHMALSHLKTTGDGVKDKHVLAQLACKTEIEDLKEPIGVQDQYAAAFGGLNYFQFSNKMVQVQPILLPEPILLLAELYLYYIGGQRSASSQLKEQSMDNETLRKMTSLAWELAHDLSLNDLRCVGGIVRQGWELKKSLSASISTPYIDTIIDTAITAGATGGKLLGAGGAGFVLLVCPLVNRFEMLNALAPFKLREVPFNFDTEGSKVLYDNTDRTR